MKREEITREDFSSIDDSSVNTEPFRPSNAGPTVEDGMPPDDYEPTYGPSASSLNILTPEQWQEIERDRARLDRLCVIAAGVLGPAILSAWEDQTFPELARRVSLCSRAILAKLEEE